MATYAVLFSMWFYMCRSFVTQTKFSETNIATLFIALSEQRNIRI